MGKWSHGHKNGVKEAALKRSISTVLLPMLAWSTLLLADTQPGLEEKPMAAYPQQHFLVGRNFIPATRIKRTPLIPLA